MQIILEKKIIDKSAKIAVIGLGYVGLPLAVDFAKAGFQVIGIDNDKDRVRNVKKGIPYILDVDVKDTFKLVRDKKLIPLIDYRKLKDADVIIICVPTPLKRKSQPNISYIKNAVSQVKGYLKKGQLIVLESTTYPGTTDEVILPMLESTGLKCGSDFYLVFSPERIDPGNEKFPFSKIPKVIGGVTAESSRLCKLLYEFVIKKAVVVSSPRAAETVKLLENTFRLINIGLVNELAMMCHKMGLDIWEIIDAAKTKPFGFMAFYPGPGVGGHCLDKREALFVKRGDSLKVMQMVDFLKYANEHGSGDIEVLSFDPVKRKSLFRKVTAVSARPYSGAMFNIITEDGRSLKVTDLHPMFVYNENRCQLKYAKDLQKGDRLPLCLGLPYPTEEKPTDIKIDLIEEISHAGEFIIEDKIRVKPNGFFWKEYSVQIKDVLRKEPGFKIPDKYWDYISDNYLPLRYFRELEKSLKIDHSCLKLASGRGPSYSEIPAVIPINEEFCRLIGYYLSEGCYTKDKSARIRFSFNRAEKEYIHDVLGILSGIGIRASVYESKVGYSSCIKVSSDIFGFLLREVLGCGTNCYNMSIPEKFFGLDRLKKKALLSGILRGDGCVEHFFGKWHYRKNEKQYYHNVNTAHISYFTSSKKLFQQVIILLQDLGIVPTFRKRKYSLSIFGYKQLFLCRDLFEGKKKELVEKYLELNKNRPLNKTFKIAGGIATVRIKSITSAKGNWVYSVETEKPHAFVTSYGICVHNCIPKDPLYLYWKAKLHGFKSRFIKLASDLNSSMPFYVVERIGEALPLKKARVMVLGVTYKKDVKDLRKSPSLDIIESLKNHGADVCYSDPLIPYLKFKDFNLKSQALNKKSLGDIDCIVIAAEHSGIDYGFLLAHARLIFDTRNVYKGIVSEKVIRL